MLTRLLALQAVLLLAPASAAHANARALSPESASLGFFTANRDFLKEISDLSHCCIKEKSTEQADSSNRREEYLRARYMDPRQGRFLGMDGYAGTIYSPFSQHDFGYAKGSPTMEIDPSGLASNLYESSISVGALAGLTVAAYLSLDYLIRGNDSIVSRSTATVWDALAITYFRSHSDSPEDSDVDSEISALLASRPEGHHTIPVYLCGSMNQQLAYIPAAAHHAIHAEIAAVRLVMLGAENYAWGVLGGRLGGERRFTVLRLAHTDGGRRSIALALDKIYAAGWDAWGAPVTIRTAFERERIPYETGEKVSLPHCTRSGDPN